ncbi:hypothetical protein PILCRDRAFT_163052 [Piloderma croceum F 1598]|uniref:Uncharacterized protein n=1 Tax=Piloderma croceum (strain F 1598) TaxID=765440 RepID=A0A0C3CN34_PILCF|nr:hypothetical protein PILCRDRAFT_163052 [Piloderma croceum F 1598]
MRLICTPIVRSFAIYLETRSRQLIKRLRIYFVHRLPCSPCHAKQLKDCISWLMNDRVAYSMILYNDDDVMYICYRQSTLILASQSCQCCCDHAWIRPAMSSYGSLSCEPNTRFLSM